MFEQSYWRRAVMVSCCIHCLIFVGVGWLGSSIFSKEAEIETIDMELISTVTLPEQAAPVPISVPQAASSDIKPAVPDVSRPTTAATKPIGSAVRDVVAERYTPAAEAAGAASGGSAEPAVPVAAAGSTAAVAPPSAAPRSLSAPRILNKVEPEYPEDARQEGVAGTVGVKVEVLENGRPGEVRVAHSSGWRSLDEAALQAVRQWRFVPAQENGSGQAVRCFTTFSVVFELS